MRKLPILAAALLAAGAAYYVLVPSDPPLTGDYWKDCDRGDNQIVVDSPDGAWTAWGVYIGCGGPMTIRAASLVAIARKGEEPGMVDEVLGGDWRMAGAKMEWNGTRHLQITLPINAIIHMQEKSIHDISIEIKFDPDDPQAREQFLRDREKKND
jgi:hypothetical protein